MCCIHNILLPYLTLTPTPGHFTQYNSLQSFLDLYSVATPQIWQVGLFTNARGRCKPSGANSKVLVTGILYEERLHRLSLHSLQRGRLRVGIIIAFNILTGLLDVDLNLFFPPPTRRGLSGTPTRYFKVRAIARGEDLSGEGREILEYFGFRRYGSFFNIFKEKLDQVWTDVFFQAPHTISLVCEHSSSLSQPPPYSLLCLCGFYRSALPFTIINHDQTMKCLSLFYCSVVCCKIVVFDLLVSLSPQVQIASRQK